MEDRKAAVRYYAGKCGPTFACGSNNKLPCAWGGVKVMLAFGKLPKKKHTPVIKRAIQHGVEFLFSVDPAEATYPSGFASKPSGNWWKFGFPVFYVTDLLQIVEALAALGYGDDPRIGTCLGRWSGRSRTPTVAGHWNMTIPVRPGWTSVLRNNPISGSHSAHCGCLKPQARADTELLTSFSQEINYHD